MNINHRILNKEILVKKENAFLIFLYSVVLLCMYTVNQGNARFSSVSYIMLTIIFLFIPVEYNIFSLFCLIPFPRAILFNRTFFTLLPILEAIIFFKWIMRVKLSGDRLKQVLLVSTIMLYSVCIEYMRFSTFQTSLEYALKLFMIITLSDLGNRAITKKCFGLLVNSVVLSIIASYVFPNTAKYVSMFQSEYVVRFNGMVSNPGEFGQILVCALAGCIVYVYMNSEDKKRRLRLIDILLIASLSGVFIYYMILSGTRTCLIGIFAIYLIVLFWFVKNTSKHIKIIGLLMAILTVTTGYILVQDLFEVFMASHGGEDLSQDNRFLIWSDYWNVWTKDIGIAIFGVGMDCCNKFGTVMKIGNPHNIIIEKIVECGFIGLLLNGTFFVSIFKEKKASIKEKINLPFYAFFSTLFFYGSVGIEILYFLIGTMDKKEQQSEIK